MIYLSKGGAGADLDHTWIRPWVIHMWKWHSIYWTLKTESYKFITDCIRGWNISFHYRVDCFQKIAPVPKLMRAMLFDGSLRKQPCHTVHCSECTLYHEKEFFLGCLQNCVSECACQISKFWLLLYLFCPHLTTHQYYTNFIRKTPNLLKLGAFYYNVLKLLQTFVCDQISPDRYTKFCKKAPQRQAHTHIPCQCETPLAFFFSTGKHPLIWIKQTANVDHLV